MDYYVGSRKEEKWDTTVRAELVQLLNHDIKMNEEYYSVTAAIDEMVKSFVSCCRQQDPSYLKLPELCEARVHQYE